MCELIEELINKWFTQHFPEYNYIKIMYMLDHKLRIWYNNSDNNDDENNKGDIRFTFEKDKTMDSFPL